MTIKRGRPKIYYDSSDRFKQYRVEEPLDLLFKDSIITIEQHKLALKLRWMFTLNFGIPTVQAYNINRVRGRGLPKYDDVALIAIRTRYKQIIEFLYLEDKVAAKALINVIIHHKSPDRNIHLIVIGAQNLEKAFNIKKKEYNIYDNDHKNLNLYVQ